MKPTTHGPPFFLTKAEADQPIEATRLPACNRNQEAILVREGGSFFKELSGLLQTAESITLV